MREPPGAQSRFMNLDNSAVPISPSVSMAIRRCDCCTARLATGLERRRPRDSTEYRSPMRRQLRSIVDSKRAAGKREDTSRDRVHCRSPHIPFLSIESECPVFCITQLCRIERRAVCMKGENVGHPQLSSRARRISSVVAQAASGSRSKGLAIARR